MGMFDDLDQAPTASVGMSNQEIRDRAHVVNGGNAMFSCPACNGTGKFYSYTGRLVGSCFKCKGTAKVTKGAIAAEKGKATRAENDRKFADEHRAELDYLRRASAANFNLMTRILAYYNDNRRLNERDLETVRKYMNQDMQRQEQRTAERAVKREQEVVTVDIAAIEKLIATAVDNKVKRPIFRCEAIEISKAPMTGRNAGALYVTRRDDEGTYLGKIFNGKFYGSRDVKPTDIENLHAVAIDPLKESIKYARKTGRCGCCGHVLVNPVSILAGIGPICADNYGLNFRRELAETEYAEMRAEEIKKIKE